MVIHKGARLGTTIGAASWGIGAPIERSAGAARKGRRWNRPRHGLERRLAVPRDPVRGAASWRSQVETAAAGTAVVRRSRQPRAARILPPERLWLEPRRLRHRQ